MADSDHEDEFDKAFEGFGETPKQPDPPAADPAKQEDPKPPAPEAPKVEEPKKDDPSKNPEEPTPPADPAKKTEEGAQSPDPSATPPAPPEEPKPLTEEGVKSIISGIRAEERDSIKELDNTTKEVLDAYYPEGLSNVLVDQTSGKELRTPQDVVDASNGEMTTEEAAQWLMNEQYKLDSEITKINNDAKRIAENTVSFKRDSVAALQKYEPLFKWQPSLQKKVFDKLMQQVKADEKKGVILQAPDVMDHYDFYLEPYQKAYEFSTNQPATNPTAPAVTPPATPGADDRMDERGDGGTTPVDDPNDFAQQVTKELAKGL